jgi:hypothetical protein
MKDKDTLILESLYEEILLEAPHIVFKTRMGSIPFDLRVEDDLKLPSGERLGKLRQKIDNILKNRKQDEIEYFWKELAEYPNIDLFLQKVYGISLQDLHIHNNL